MVENSDEVNAAALIFNNDISHHPLNVDLPPQDGIRIDFLASEV